MPPIFISYSSSHRNLTRHLAAELEKQYGPGSVWWDHALESWGDYEVQIRNAQNEARAVIVIWTKAAGDSDWVKAEAQRANRQNKLINVRPADTVWDDIPSPYNQHHINQLDDIEGILRSVQTVWEGKPLPTVIPLHEIFFRTHDRRLIETRRMPLVADTAHIRPTSLLQAKYEVIDYFELSGLKDDLLAWSVDGARPASGRLIHGPGGVGKTRMMIETAARLRDEGWAAGFLTGRAGMSETVLKERRHAIEQLISHGEDKGLLLVLDYAEGQQEDVTWLSEAFMKQAAARNERPLRLVLLARSAGGWWAALRQEHEAADHLFYSPADQGDGIALPVVETAEQRLAFFDRCRNGFAGILRGQGPEPSGAELPAERRQRIADGDGYLRPLAIEMEALLLLYAATPEAQGIDRLLDNMLGVERGHWDKLLGMLDADMRDDMNRGLAQVTAVQGVPDQPSAERLLMADGKYAGRRLAPVDVRAVHRNLATVYGNGEGGVIPLEPDLIGEHLLAGIGDDALIEGCLSWIEGEPETSRPKRRRDMLTALQRATLAEHGERVADRAAERLRHLSATKLEPLAADLVAVIAETPGRLETILTSQLDGLDDDGLAALDAALPLQSLALMEFSLAVAARRADLARLRFASAEREDDLDTDARSAVGDHLAARLVTFGNRLSDLGRREEALDATREAADIYRRLAETRPDAFLPNLATSLSALGATLNGAGHHSEAANAFREGLAVIAPFLAKHPQAFAGLARSLGAEYIQACEQAGEDPEIPLLEEVATALPGAGNAGAEGTAPAISDQMVERALAEEGVKALVAEFMRQNEIEGTPETLPMETRRALVVALVQQGVLQFDDAEDGRDEG